VEDRSLFAPWQKFDAVATLILLRMDFCLRGSRVVKRPLAKLDRALKRTAKCWMSLLQRASAEFVILPLRVGGDGLLPLADLTDVLTIAHAYRILSSEDVSVRELAWSTLSRTISRSLWRDAQPQHLAAYLSGEMEGEFTPLANDSESLWSRARSAAREMPNRVGVR
jgi:hypothetical protein